MSTLKVNAIQNTSGVEQYLAKAWVNFNGTGTVAIRASGNVSSISDLGTGYYQINMTTAMPDTNYVCLCATDNRDIIYTHTQTARPVTTSVADVRTAQSNSPSGEDYLFVQVAIFR